jgi:hypothetical protein
VACARGLAEQEGIVTATQEEAVEYVKGAVVNAGGSLEELTRAANYFSKGNGFVALYRPLTFEEIVSSIDDGHIISASCGYFIGNYRMGGHSVLIIGYDVRKEKQYLHYYDPLTGETTEITYQYFCERPAGRKTLRYQYSVFYTEDEAMIASAAELAKEWENQSQNLDLHPFVIECLGVIGICLIGGFTWCSVMTKRRQK